MNSHKPHRWFRFSLRTLLVVTALVGIVMSWIAKERTQSNRELEIAKQLRATSTDVDVRGLFDDLSKPPDEQAGWRTLLSALLGGRIREVASVNENVDLTPLAELRSLEKLFLTNTHVSDLQPLARVKTLKVLHLSETKVTDLGPLAGLTNLRELELMMTAVSDITPLGELSGLVVLNLHSTRVKNVSPLAGLKNLKELDLAQTPSLSDVSPLATLQNLKLLIVFDTNVSSEQVNVLQQALPNCRIAH